MNSKSYLPLLRLAALLLSFVAATLCSQTSPPTQERHVVLVVWDGMRPDFVTPRHTPALWRLGREGVFFRHHHSVYPTSTNVNGVALATGVYPNHSGILANREYRPGLRACEAIDTGEWESIKNGDEVGSGKYLAAPTVAELVRSAGRSTAIVGAKTVVFLHDRNAEWTTAATKEPLTVFAGAPMPTALRDATRRLLGPFLTRPEHSNAQRNTFATRALTNILWRDGVPAFSLLWLSEPDLSQHKTAPGSGTSLAAVRNADRNLAAVLEALTSKHVLENTDVLAVSDHGFSTIERSVDCPAALHSAGFEAVTKFTETPRAGQILVVGNGGTILFYVIGHDHAVTARLVEWLQHSDFAAVIFARDKFEGTFTLATAHADTIDAPDVMVALRWSSQPNRSGIPGSIVTNTAPAPVEGSHASLSPFDVHNTLIAAGPDFRCDTIDELPTGNVDIAPTILHLLGLPAPANLDGRVLFEALREENKALAEISYDALTATRTFGDRIWRQHLQLSQIRGAAYIDQGDGTYTPVSSLKSKYQGGDSNP